MRGPDGTSARASSPPAAAVVPPSVLGRWPVLPITAAVSPSGSTSRFLETGVMPPAPPPLPPLPPLPADNGPDAAASQAAIGAPAPAPPPAPAATPAAAPASAPAAGKPAERTGAKPPSRWWARGERATPPATWASPPLGGPVGDGDDGGGRRRAPRRARGLAWRTPGAGAPPS